MLADSINGTDTIWTAYSGTSFVGCSYPIVPSVITDPIMSSGIMATWLDSGAITRDSLDTCVVQVSGSDGYYNIYSIDMATGTIIAAYLNSVLGAVSHLYFYGHQNGIYFLRKVCTSSYDTTLDNGGYIFYNIRVNDTLMSPVVQDEPRKERLRPGTMGAGNGRKTLVLAPGATARLAFYDLLGKNLYEKLVTGWGGPVALDRSCPASNCRSGTFVVRVEQPGFRPATSFFSR